MHTVRFQPGTLAIADDVERSDHFARQSARFFQHGGGQLGIEIGQAAGLTEGVEFDQFVKNEFRVLVGEAVVAHGARSACVRVNLTNM
jgi:hypothetical protein